MYVFTLIRAQKKYPSSPIRKASYVREIIRKMTILGTMFLVARLGLLTLDDFNANVEISLNNKLELILFQSLDKLIVIHDFRVLKFGSR